MEFNIRKVILLKEEIFHENGPVQIIPRLRGAAIAIVANPYAGKYHEDLQSGTENLKELGLMLTDRLISCLGGIKGIDGYGKASNQSSFDLHCLSILSINLILNRISSTHFVNLLF